MRTGHSACPCPTRGRTWLGIHFRQGNWHVSYRDTAFLWDQDSQHIRADFLWLTQSKPILLREDEEIDELDKKPSAKPLAIRFLPKIGDLDRTGHVTIKDAVALFDLFLYGTPVDALSIRLGDIDQDGQTDWTDLALLGDFLQKGLPQDDNPYNIGKKVQLGTASLVPNPEETSFSSNGAWETFTVQTDMDSVHVVVNPPRSDVILEVAGGYRAPSRSYCGAEAEDSPTRPRRNNYKLHLAGCASGRSKVLLKDYIYGLTLVQYEIAVQEGNEQDERD